MAAVSDNYLSVLDKMILNAIPLENVNMSCSQKLRTRIVYEAYQVWLFDKQINPGQIIRSIAKRVYSDLLHKAKDDPETAKICQFLKIDEHTVRTHTEVFNDIHAFNYIVGRLEAPAENIEKAKVVDASDWLIREGMKNGDVRAVSKGAELKLTLNNNFERRKNDFENIATTAINITGDVSVIKVDRENYSDEEKKRLAKKYGISLAETENLLSTDNGEYVEFEPVEDEPEEDFFESAEKEMEHKN